jgi:hypothetical protein
MTVAAVCVTSPSSLPTGREPHTGTQPRISEIGPLPQNGPICGVSPHYLRGFPTEWAGFSPPVEDMRATSDGPRLPGIRGAGGLPDPVYRFSICAAKEKEIKTKR